MTFITRMQALLEARLAAETDEEREQAEQQMAELIRECHQDRRAAKDWQRAAAGERED